MQLSRYIALTASLALASARDAGKFMKTVPTISNSLVNLGKMEISFHFNGKQQDVPLMADNNVHADYYSKPAAEESCPCNNFKQPSMSSDPTEIINKILKSNDLFKDPTSSICCESSEHVQESTVVFEVNPNNIPSYTAPKTLNPSNNFQAFSNMLRAPVFPSFIPINPAAPGSKPKTVEIYMFPTKKNDMSFDFANFLKPRKAKEANITKSDLQVIRDGIQQSPSVKKDLTLLEKKNGVTVEVTKEELQTDAPPVTNVMNNL